MAVSIEPCIDKGDRRRRKPGFNGIQSDAITIGFAGSNKKRRTETLATTFAVIASIGTCVGMLGVWWSIADISAKQHSTDAAIKETTILQWQEPAVYRTIEASGPKGITFAALLKEYSISGLTAEGIDVPKARLGEFALRRILIDLMAKRVIAPLGTDKFKVLAECEFCGGASRAGSEVVSRCLGKALAWLSQENGTKTPSQVTEYFRRTFSLEEGEEELLFNALMGFRWIGIHKTNGKVYQLTKTAVRLDDIYTGGAVILERPMSERTYPMPPPEDGPALGNVPPRPVKSK